MINTGKAEVTLSIDFKNNRIRIHKNTLMYIGQPDYIILLINPDIPSLAIICSNYSSLQAHNVTIKTAGNKKSFELYSKALIKNLHSIYNGWQSTKSYRIYGEIIADKGMAHFQIRKAIEIKKYE